MSAAIAMASAIMTIFLIHILPLHRGDEKSRPSNRRKKKHRHDRRDHVEPQQRKNNSFRPWNEKQDPDQRLKQSKPDNKKYQMS
jgi:hypothetical protein